MRHWHWLAIPCSLMLIWAMTFSSPTMLVALAQTTCGGWHVVSSPSPGPAANDLYGISAVSSKDAWAVGEYGPPGGGVNTLTEHWDGKQWSEIPSPNVGEGNYLYSVSAVSSHDVWAVGDTYPPGGGIYTLIEHWNGVQWSVIPSPNPNQTDDYLYGVSALSSHDVWAVGVRGAYSLIEHWDGMQWSVMPSPNPDQNDDYLYGVSALSSTNVWAVGIRGAVSLVEHWNGTRWSVIPSPNPSSSADYLYGVSAISNHAVWTVGNYSSRKGGTATLIERWNGKKWQQVSSPSPGAFANILYGVAALSSSNAWAVGEYLPTPSAAYTLTEHWNGKAWKVVPSPSPGPSHLLRAAAEVPGTSHAWTVGFYTNDSGKQTLVEAYC